MIVTKINGPFSEFTSQEFEDYSTALIFAKKVDGTIDGPFHDYDGSRYYVVTFKVRNFNFTK